MANSIIREIIEEHRAVYAHSPHTSGSGGGAGIDITGLEYRMSTVSPTTAIIVESGSCIDSSGQVVIDITTDTEKYINSSFAVGSGNGGLSTTSNLSAGTMYHIFAIAKSDGTSDVLLDVSENTPTLPTGFIYHRWIGYVWTNFASTDIVEFWMSGNGLSFKGEHLISNDLFFGNINVILDLNMTTFAPYDKISHYSIGAFKRSEYQVGGWAQDCSVGVSYFSGLDGGTMYVLDAVQVRAASGLNVYHGTYGAAGDKNQGIPTNVNGFPQIAFSGSASGEIFGIVISDVVLKRGSSGSSSSNISNYPPASATVEMEGGIVGLNYEMGTDPLTDINVLAGYCYDSTGQKVLNLTTDTEIGIDTTWSEGTSGGLATGTVQSSAMYHIFIIGKEDETVSLIIDDNITCNNIPLGYTYYRWIGYVWTKNDGISTDLVEFWMFGNELTFKGDDVPYALVNTTIYTTGNQYDMSNGAPLSKITNYWVGNMLLGTWPGPTYIKFGIFSDLEMYSAQLQAGQNIYVITSVHHHESIPNVSSLIYISASYERPYDINIRRVTLKR